MNIVYGVSGEGLGHVFEAMELAAALKADGHNVKVLTYGDRALKSLAGLRPTPIEGIHLYFDSRGLSLWRTLRGNSRWFRFLLAGQGRVIRELKEFRPDVFITAYEPFTTFASHRLRKPLISVDNQNELRFLRRPPGAGYFAFHLARWTTWIATWGAAEYVVKSFERTGRGADRVHLVAPIIQEEIKRLQPTIGAHVLVYLTKPNPDLIEVLKTIDETFVVYCHNRTGGDGNISFRAQGPDYLPDLAACKAIIATTGFSLIADSLYLKKPYFGVPLRKQFEQTHNAHFLRRSGLGEYSEAPTREEIVRFLGALPGYRVKLAGYTLDPDEEKETLRKLLSRMQVGGSALEDAAVANSSGC